MTSIAKSKVLSAAAFGITAAIVYLGAKYFSRGLIGRDLWMALVVALVVGIGSSLPWRKPRNDD